MLSKSTKVTWEALHTAVADTELKAVAALCQAFGYDRVMHATELLWSQRARGGHLTVGPCAAALVPCICSEYEPGACDWCGGVGRVTKRVREVQLATRQLSASA